MLYKKERSYIIELLKCAITNQTPSLPAETIHWDYIFNIAKKHKIIPTLYFAIQKLPKSQQQAVKYYNQYLLAYKKTLVLDANRAYEIETLKSDFEKNNLDYIFLKGSITKYLYPDTAMRVMSDIDIFYRGASTKCVDRIFLKNGYKVSHREPKEVSYFKPINKIYIEMQTQLVDEGYENWFHYLSTAWERFQKEDNSHEYKMTREDFYIYHMIHMAKHFINGGIGLTHVMDVWMMMHSYADMDYKYIEEQLNILKLSSFNKNIQMLALQWFGDNKSGGDNVHILTLLEDYIFSSGAFGIKSQQEISAMIRRDDDKISLRKKIFPNRNTMIDYYGSILKKYPWLVPFYWIRLNCKRIVSDRKKIKNNINVMNSISREQIDLTKELMRECGFIKKK